MRYAKGAVDQLVKMFVTDWAQAALTLALLLLAALAIRAWPGRPELGFGLAALLTGQLVYGTWSEARHRRAQSS